MEWRWPCQEKTMPFSVTCGDTCFIRRTWWSWSSEMDAMRLSTPFNDDWQLLDIIQDAQPYAPGWLLVIATCEHADTRTGHRHWPRILFARANQCYLRVWKLQCVTFPHGMGCFPYSRHTRWCWWMAWSCSNVTLTSDIKIPCPGQGKSLKQKVVFVRVNATHHLVS